MGTCWNWKSIIKMIKIPKAHYTDDVGSKLFFHPKEKRLWWVYPTGEDGPAYLQDMISETTTKKELRAFVLMVLPLIV